MPPIARKYSVTLTMARVLGFRFERRRRFQQFGSNYSMPHQDLGCWLGFVVEPLTKRRNIRRSDLPDCFVYASINKLIDGYGHSVQNVIRFWWMRNQRETWRGVVHPEKKAGSRLRSKRRILPVYARRLLSIVMDHNAKVLPDLLRPGLDLVICGTAAGQRSADTGAYYAGQGNKFWQILEQTKLTPRRLNPSEFKLLPSYGIGLTDLAKRYSGPDAGLRAGDWDVAGLRRSIQMATPKVLAFNAKKAAEVYLTTTGEIPRGSLLAYGRLAEQISKTIVFVLPSTSGSANKWWDAEVWQELAGLVRRIRSVSRP